MARVKTDKKAARGQFFTTSQNVQSVMISLIEHDKDAFCLEPSAGEGDLVKALESAGYSNIRAIEIDSSIVSICNTHIKYQSFFDACTDDRTYDVVLGNPPYVAWKNIEKTQQLSASLQAVKQHYSDKTNFYMLFMDRLIDLLADKGEMILIVPKEWLYAASADYLRQKMFHNGTITHIVNIDEEKVFDDAMPTSVMIFRYVKGIQQKHIQVADSLNDAISGSWKTMYLCRIGNRMAIADSDIMEMLSDGWISLGSLYTPRVGIVSGADRVYRCDDDIACDNGIVSYITTKGIEKFIDPTGLAFDELCPYAKERLLENKKALISRGIMHFDESNWYQYGAVRNREQMLSDAERFYVLMRTRNAKPFFDDEPYRKQGVVLYSGGILGLFRNENAPEAMNKQDIINYLNSELAADIYQSLGIMTGNKKTFLPSLVQDIPVPYKLIEKS